MLGGTCAYLYCILIIYFRSDINPFDSQEAKPFRADPEIVAMNKLVGAYQNNDLLGFENVLEENREAIMADPFIREHIEELLNNIRSQVVKIQCVTRAITAFAFLIAF